MIDKSLFTTAEIHERTIELADGSKHVLHFRELSAAEFRRFQLAELSPDDEKRAGSLARLISICLCEPDGKTALTFEQALSLKPGPAAAMLNAILELNGFGKRPGNV